MVVTKKYIRFMNKADNVSRLALEKLGYSTKRNDSTTIGKFGSGIKFAPIAALRSGLEWIFVGCDNNGKYVLNYKVEKEDDIDCIVYDYGDYQKPSSFTADAGVLSWVDPFQIYREALANAVDAVSDRSEWSVDIVDSSSIVYTPGYFSCFISASKEMIEVHENFDKYFCLDRVPVFSYRNHMGWKYEIYPKVDDKARFYSHGVLVSCVEDKNSVYDYNFESLTLNEERTVKSIWDLDAEVVKFITSIKDTSIQKNYITAGLSASSDDYYEFSKINGATYTYYTFADSWTDTFCEMHGDKAVIYDKVAQARGAREYIQLRGYKACFIGNDTMYTMTKAMGLSEYSSIADESMMYETDFNIDDHPRLRSAIAIAARFEPGINDLVKTNRIGLYTSENASLGLTINMNKEQGERVILVERSHIDEEIHHIVATIIHEYDHLSSGLPDGNVDGRIFRDLADNRIGKLMVRFYQKNEVSVVDGQLYFPMKFWVELFLNGGAATFSLEKIDILNSVLLIVGDSSFMINEDALYMGKEVDGAITSAFVISSDGLNLTIPNLTDVTLIRSVSV